jgi:hypothetical protein
MLVAALLLALLQPLEAEEGTAFSDRQPVRVAPLSSERAFTAFRDICVTPFPDPAAFDAAAGAADLALVKRSEPQRGAREWSSPHGHVVLRQAPSRSAAERRDRREGRAARQRWQLRCDFWLALEEERDLASLLHLISDRLAGGRPPSEEIVGVSWELGPDPAGGTRKLLWIPSIDDPRLFTLSLQRLTDNSAR